MTSPAPGVGEVAAATVGPGPVPSTDPGPAAALPPTPELMPVPAPPATEPAPEPALAPTSKPTLEPTLELAPVPPPPTTGAASAAASAEGPEPVPAPPVEEPDSGSGPAPGPTADDAARVGAAGSAEAGSADAGSADDGVPAPPVDHAEALEPAAEAAGSVDAVPVPAPPAESAELAESAVPAPPAEPAADVEPDDDAESAAGSEPVDEAVPADEPVPAPPADKPVPAPSPAEAKADPDPAEADPTPPLPPPPAPTPEQAPAPRAASLPMRPVRRIPASGERLGRFTLAEALGHGGFAHVYEARADDGTQVALKVLTGLHDDARERFAQEAHLLERLDGRGFPRFVEAGLDATQPWFAMELVPGTTLRDRVREEGPLTGPQALGLARQIVDALLVLQEERCLHRDLKPANIMVDGDRAVLIDLGIAKVFDAATSTQPAGTMSYMAPELFGRRVHPRSDVYSLGLLLVHAATGDLPLDLNFLGRDLEPADLVDAEVAEAAGVEPPVIDRHLQSLILAMTRYQPNHRPPLENIASVVRARIASTTPDPTLLLTSQLVSDGVTAAEVAALPATEMLSGKGHTKRFRRGPDRSDDVTPTRVPEPWHALVYDRALMSVLTEVHADGFDGAAEQVVANHVAEIGAEVAGGRTPAEIKDWIWQAMRWQVTTPPEGHADTLRGWRAFRNPEPAPASKRAPVTSRTRSATPIGSAGSGARTPGSPAPAAPPSAASTQVVRGSVPPPQSFQPRKSPVKHLGPAPRQAAPSPSVRATRPMPAVQPGRQPTAQPTQQQPTRQQGARPAAQAAPQPVRQSTRKPTAQPPVQPTAVQRPVAGRPQVAQPARPQGAPARQKGKQRPVAQAPVAPRKRPWPVRLLGALLRWVPRLLLVAAVYVLVTQDAQGGDPYLAAPALGTAAFGLAVLLRVAGHRMWVWFYVLTAVLVAAGSAFMWANSTGQLVLG
ncbi:protein kinase [Promicromonospora sukumoe]|uniref:protein kinase domain-containing protein n=1 Tax=Promicromonospora sukumoe TaxID=88382 RepID=UPI00364A1036